MITESVSLRTHASRKVFLVETRCHNHVCLCCSMVDSLRSQLNQDAQLAAQELGRARQRAEAAEAGRQAAEQETARLGSALAELQQRLQAAEVQLALAQQQLGASQQWQGQQQDGWGAEPPEAGEQVGLLGALQ
jgi:hypothetical protein